jgi:hypothetical protein
MAEQKKPFPMLPIAHWWALRKKFKQSIPGIVTDKYLATVLEMEVNSARANVLPFLKTLGIIDDEGKTTDRAKLWRDDIHYPEVCQAIVKEVYSKDLIEAVPNPNQERSQAERWFANHTGTGHAAVRRMAALYATLVEADASKQPGQEKKSPPKKAQKQHTKPRETRMAKAAANETASSPLPSSTQALSGPIPIAPGININLQIHISADASSDQIDQIFASMAKHIYKCS